MLSRLWVCGVSVHGGGAGKAWARGYSFPGPARAAVLHSPQSARAALRPREHVVDTLSPDCTTRPKLKNISVRARLYASSYLVRYLEAPRSQDDEERRRLALEQPPGFSPCLEAARPGRRLRTKAAHSSVAPCRPVVVNTTMSKTWAQKPSSILDGVARTLC